jgi:hypothetical protein
VPVAVEVARPNHRASEEGVAFGTPDGHVTREQVLALGGGTERITDVGCGEGGGKE